MARPSLKTEKTEIILTAYEHCVARYGVEGATLQRVADTAGMARPLLRHYIGNQEELLKQCSQRYVTRSLAQLEELLMLESVDELLTVLFDDTSESTQTNVAISSALVLASSEYPFLKMTMADWFSQYQNAFEEVLTNLLLPEQQEYVTEKATSLLGIYFNYHTLQHLADKSFETLSLNSAKLLLSL